VNEEGYFIHDEGCSGEMDRNLNDCDFMEKIIENSSFNISSNALSPKASKGKSFKDIVPCMVA